MEKDSEKVIVDREILQYQHITFALETLYDVREAQVFRVGIDSSTRLVALLVPENDSITFSLLRRQLHEVLPEVPVPEELIIVDSIERNSSPHELLNMYDKIFKQEVAYVKPSNAIEAYLVWLWGELLPVGRISVTDDFFALGGHSLLVAQMHFAIERDMGININFELMLCTSVLEELALLITQKKDLICE